MKGTRDVVASCHLKHLLQGAELLIRIERPRAPPDVLWEGASAVAAVAGWSSLLGPVKRSAYLQSVVLNCWEEGGGVSRVGRWAQVLAQRKE